MRKSKAETAETRQRIVDIAARQFRSNGIHATGLTDVMSEAGLTNGGFYKHFESKDQLVAEAFQVGIDGVIESLEAAAANHSALKDAFEAIVETYVSEYHRDHGDSGCPVASMGSELVRSGEKTRDAADRGIEDMVKTIAKRIDTKDPKAARADAVFTLAAMIGGLTLSRLFADTEAKAFVLETVKQHLVNV